jgi:Arc/MetJ family transcription regulator
MKMNVELDDALVAEAFQLTAVRTETELLNLALRALIKDQKKRNLLDLSGQIQFDPDFSPAALRQD